MSIISNTSLSFKSSKFLFAKIEREFKDYKLSGHLDVADFPQYIADVLKELGISVYKEEDCLLDIEDGKATLPDNFELLYSAYSCPRVTKTKDRVLQKTTILENDITCFLIQRDARQEPSYDDCGPRCRPKDKIIERMEIREYVNEQCYEEKGFRLLNVAPHSNMYCYMDMEVDKHCKDVISMNDGVLYAPFDEGQIYIKYYAFPLDEEGVPLVPDQVNIERAIEWWIKWQVLLKLWFTNDIPDIVNKWQKAEQQYNFYLAEAKNWIKLPSFQTMTNWMLQNKKINKQRFFEAYLK